MLALVNNMGVPILLSSGMDAVKSTNPKDASSYLGYQILLSSEKDPLKSPNPNGCYLLVLEWMM